MSRAGSTQPDSLITAWDQVVKAVDEQLVAALEHGEGAVLAELFAIMAGRVRRMITEARDVHLIAECFGQETRDRFAALAIASSNRCPEVAERYEHVFSQLATFCDGELRSRFERPRSKVIIAEWRCTFPTGEPLRTEIVRFAAEAAEAIGHLKVAARLSEANGTPELLALALIEVRRILADPMSDPVRRVQKSAKYLSTAAYVSINSCQSYADRLANPRQLLPSDHELSTLLGRQASAEINLALAAAEQEFLWCKGETRHIGRLVKVLELARSVVPGLAPKSFPPPPDIEVLDEAWNRFLGVYWHLLQRYQDHGLEDGWPDGFDPRLVFTDLDNLSTALWPELERVQDLKGGRELGDWYAQWEYVLARSLIGPTAGRRVVRHCFGDEQRLGCLDLMAEPAADGRVTAVGIALLEGVETMRLTIVEWGFDSRALTNPWTV